MTHHENNLRTVQVIQYITPLREGGSMPAIAKANDDFLYALKFRGAGQGVKALIAELIGGEIAREIGLKVPELVFAELDEAFGRTEPDEEIQDLLKASIGLNLALHYLSGAITFDANVNKVDPLLASKIVWLDSLLINMDRTPRNTNMLMWHKELWLIDHGAALYFHHNWPSYKEQAVKPFKLIQDHVLLPSATLMEQADTEIKMILTNEVIDGILDKIPKAWLDDRFFESAEANKEAYAYFLKTRLANSEMFIKEVEDAR